MKKRGTFSVELVIALILIATIFAFSIDLSDTNNKTTQANQLKDQCVFLDDVLATWYKNHGKMYPDTLTRMQNMGFLTPTMDLSVFEYSTINDYGLYRLRVVLPVGGTYTSPGSKF